MTCATHTSLKLTSPFLVATPPSIAAASPQTSLKPVMMSPAPVWAGSVPRYCGWPVFSKQSTPEEKVSCKSSFSYSRTRGQYIHWGKTASKVSVQAHLMVSINAEGLKRILAASVVDRGGRGFSELARS